MGRTRSLAALAKDIDASGNITSDGIASGVSLGGGLETYDSLGLLPISGLTNGDQAFVGNRLYISNGSGWYNVGLVNLDPSIDSGPDGASYDLDSNGGTATSISLSATDSDGTPILWSYTTSDSAYDLSTITNDSNGTFTITGKSLADILSAGYDSNGGSFTVTFKASDGISFDTDSASFSLTYYISADFDATASSTNLSTGTNVYPDGGTVEVTEDGTRLVASGTNGYTYIWTLSTAYDLSTKTNQQVSDFTVVSGTGYDTSWRGVRVSADKSKAFAINWYNAALYMFNQSSSHADYPADISGSADASYDMGIRFNTSGHRWDFAGDGSAIYTCSAVSGNRLWVIPLGTSWDITTAGTPVGNTDMATLSGQTFTQESIAVNGDGTRLWLGGTNGNIYQFSMSTANDPSTLSYDGSWDTPATAADALSHSNGYLYVRYSTNVYQYGNS